jgi:hypothetical protein
MVRAGSGSNLHKAQALIEGRTPPVAACLISTGSVRLSDESTTWAKTLLAGDKGSFMKPTSVFEKRIKETSIRKSANSARATPGLRCARRFARSDRKTRFAAALDRSVRPNDLRAAESWATCWATS